MRKMLLGFVFAITGFGPAFDAAAEPVTIAAMGDSLTQGYGLPHQDGLVPQLGAWLAGQGADVILINAGVSGDTTAGGAARAAWTLTPDVDAMILALGANDLLRGIAPEVARANLKTILDQARAANVAVLLIGQSAPGNFGPAYKQAFDRIYPDLARDYDTLYVKNFFTGIMDSDGRILVRLLQNDGLHPTREGVAQIVEVLGPDILELISQAGNAP